MPIYVSINFPAKFSLLIINYFLVYFFFFCQSIFTFVFFISNGNKQRIGILYGFVSKSSKNVFSDKRQTALSKQLLQVSLVLLVVLYSLKYIIFYIKLNIKSEDLLQIDYNLSVTEIAQ